MGKYSKHNAEEVLKNVEACIAEGRTRRIEDVYESLSIFDWFSDSLSINKLKQMRTFLKEAIKLGYTGYVCFKVGATGCANGMWAATEESTDGHSPQGCPTLYRSFTPAYTYWDITDKAGNWDWDDQKAYDDIESIRQLEAYIKAHPVEVYTK